MPQTVPPARVKSRAGGGPTRIDLLPPPPGTGPDDHLHVGVYRQGTALIRSHGVDTPLEPGDLLISSAPQPPNLLHAVSSTFLWFRVPRFYLAPARGELAHLNGLRAPGSTGIGSLASRFLLELATWERATGRPHHELPTSRHRLAHHAADLLSLLITDLLEKENAPQMATSAELLSRIRRHIDANLMDPDLSPESIARAHHISVRYLHKLFQKQGVTVGQWVRRRRLEECRRELARTPSRTSTVAVVAHRWGFISAAHFSRVFRDAFGISPSQWQTHASDPGRQDLMP
ncbi:helix-turn-helix domain-containing protein [Streptomyces sp. RerS4]|uniref:helix-turn-helix domain-containing protein n=1 Tax=Streptomyces sp. RerS4 TaxID=2942449 RepID=UPI00201BB118|nr:helix-turn-helix domain-containing protein [Streptomyces sp. RerS4]UQW99357.1 helix-turn-helix domain-containing protein [Streptomyces sp. RerS4]